MQGTTAETEKAADWPSFLCSYSANGMMEAYEVKKNRADPSACPFIGKERSNQYNRWKLLSLYSLCQVRNRSVCTKTQGTLGNFGLFFDYFLPCWPSSWCAVAVSHVLSSTLLLHSGQISRQPERRLFYSGTVCWLATRMPKMPGKRQGIARRI